MKVAPKIGDRVKYNPSYEGRKEWAGYVGTVMKIHKSYDDQWDEETDVVTRGPVRSEEEWKVSLKLDEQPPHWSYGPDLRFCPDVSEVEKLP